MTLNKRYLLNGTAAKCLVALGLLLASCAPTGSIDADATSGDSADLKAAVLAHLDRQQRQSCNFRSLALSAPSPIKTVDLPSQRRAIYKNAESYAAYIHGAATRYFFGGETSSADRAISLMVQWAEARAHENVIPETNSVSTNRYPTYMILGSSLNALFLLDRSEALTPEREKVIWSWLDQLARDSFIGRPLPRGSAGFQDREQRVNNHNARRAVITAYLAAHKNDSRLLAQSQRMIARGFAEVDKGVPFDANRGDWALNYANLAILGFSEHTAFTRALGRAENLSQKVSDINAMAEFLFNETIKQDKVHTYARQNVGRPSSSYGGVQEIWWTERYTGGLTHYAWIDADILSFQPPLSLSAPRYSEVGGYLGCWF